MQAAGQNVSRDGGAVGGEDPGRLPVADPIAAATCSALRLGLVRCSSRSVLHVSAQHMCSRARGLP
jgi:hypothetical protein